METVEINVSKKYDIKIGRGLIEKSGEFVKEFEKIKKIAVITDDIVDKLYSKIVVNSLENAGFEVVKYVIPNGEHSKNSENFIEILNFLAENELTRTDCVFALGGGVVGDLSGFCAATYLRGIHFIQCPTTLLAMVDSSVGGKTAIDLKAGKNLAGAFYQPDLVICDCNTLKTLSEEIFSDGCAEIIKYGAISDKNLLSHLKEKGLNFDLEKVIKRCVELKCETVTKDEFDLGLRQLLNFGHTIGHSIEALSRYEISHGKGVAMGMAIITKACVKNGLCEKNVENELVEIIEKFKLPINSPYKTDEMIEIIKNDKKRKGDNITLVVPESLGKCVLKTIPIAEIKNLLD